MSALSPLSVALLVAVTIGLAAALLAWRERPEPGATWLAVLLAGQVWWATFLVFELEAATLPAKALWYDVQWIGVVAIPVGWFFFALEYTGRDRYVTPFSVALVAVVPAATVAVAAAGDPGSLLAVDRVVRETGVGTVLDVVPGPLYYVIAGYTYLLGAVGSVPLIRLIRDDARPFRGQSAALLIGTAAPWAGSVAYLSGAIPVPGLDPTPLVFAVSGVAYLLALSRFRLLTLAPAPRRRARQLVFEQLHDPVFVVGTEGFIVDLNESAAETFGVDRRTAIGKPAPAVVPKYDAVRELDAGDGGKPRAIPIVGRDGQRPYEATVRGVVDDHDRTTARVITFHDVGAYLGQQQRLNVLNRVFRHDVRTETNLIQGYAERLRADPTDERALTVIEESAGRMLELSERTRAAGELFDPTEEFASAPLPEIVDDAVADARGLDPDAAVEVGPMPAVTVPVVLRVVLENLCSNAVRHNDAEAPWVGIDAAAEDGWVDVTVADDGPGIDPAEYDVLDRGTETPLRHGSGIGLWIVKWGVDHLGGRIRFDERDPRGTAVTVCVPLDRSEADGDDCGTDRDEPSPDDEPAGDERAPLGSPPGPGR
ncbi:histidine kinase N-terminal 7TM domain-containing protein [Halorubrum sp. 2020YC2]|uniref:histidine kinase N-terminal 7TM domain-containing protein n=1 Tax=Halorubrum sp. 2020YC2 TaxID=2836432 RepID=UPI001BEAFF3A|nr:histidine kinase N-terminal 7TM domain-containing protein [Halorubrum sp. 2020YC2]QWC20305.1 ATP-binding protein [Halorubrum sp. 2020YC2]